MGIREDTAEQVRKRLHAERENKKMTMAELAQALTAKGIRSYATTIAKIEAGDRAVRVDELVAMAEIFDVPVDSLLGQQGRPDWKLAWVLRGAEDAAHSALGDIRTHQRALAGFCEEVAVLSVDGVPSPALQGVAEAAHQAIHDLRTASTSLIALVAKAMPLSLPLESEEVSHGQA
jgi:transcriptional regulator with XRE-family HTH domain